MYFQTRSDDDSGNFIFSHFFAILCEFFAFFAVSVSVLEQKLTAKGAKEYAKSRKEECKELSNSFLLKSRHEHARHSLGIFYSLRRHPRIRVRDQQPAAIVSKQLAETTARGCRVKPHVPSLELVSRHRK